MIADDDGRIVPFPGPEPVPDEERARRLRLEVERLARLPTVEWMFYLDDVTKKHGVDKAVLREMIETVIKEIDKKAAEDRGERHRQEDRADKKQEVAERAAERKADREARERAHKEREQARKEREARKEAEKKEREKREAFAAIIELPSAMHEVRLAELAERLGEDLEVLSAEFAVFVDSTDRRRGDAVEPWSEPVTTEAILADVIAQFRRYIVVHDDEAIAVALWCMFAWIHDIATHSPLLTFRSPTPNTGKTASCSVVGFLTPRSQVGGELTGPSLFRFVDRVHPTLIIDNADRLLKRRPDLASIVEGSWTRTFKIPRIVNRETVWFDPFCPKVLSGKRLTLSDATETRTINVRLKRKLPTETVEPFSYTDDETFFTLRCKLARWANDNKKELKRARPVRPEGFDNRLGDNWRLLFAIADLAGGNYPKAARAAAIRLSHQPEPDEGVRLLAALREELARRAELPSKEFAQNLNADPTAEWCNFRGRGPITQTQIAVLLREFDIHPVMLHPTKRPTVSLRGYKRGPETDDAFRRYLPSPKKRK
jgi:putative DNA primase/helicase